ncbi:diacylglycerol lipase-alpha-like [Lineus longissimus]|uniref:diacylglycerol lipase-alpha-like n=1 Tax=Lineus longissimus TaxID=88925 RepID=UPI00315D02EF
MPGIVVFKRRWTVGSDDFVVPAVFLLVLHIIWIIVLGVILAVVTFDVTKQCMVDLQEHILGYLVILSGCIVMEWCIAWISMRGTILNTEPRRSMQYLLYVRLAILIVEFSWLVVGVIWISEHYDSCGTSHAKSAVLGIIVCNWIVMSSVLISLWCTFDTAGRSWVKMKRYQESVKEREKRAGRRSGSRRRNWRHRKAVRQYEASWDRRFRLLFCCVQNDANGQNSFTEVAKLFTEFFRELDVVPSDVIAGLMLLRNYQKSCRKLIVNQGSNDVYQFLSGVAVTPKTRFLRLMDPEVMLDYKNVVYYMHYALAAYGWPMYMMVHTARGCCSLTKHLRCSCCFACTDESKIPAVVGDNCCLCHYAALKEMSNLTDAEIIYVTYHVDIGETPFYVALDHDMKKVVISIRGTLSLQDVLTDLKAEAEPLPVQPAREDWLGHKGMVENAIYIKKVLKEERILAKAFGKDLERGTKDYDLTLVGHSLGAGTAAILAILLRQEYPTLHCYAYSPPGGLLSMTAMEETKSFITSVVVGKDVVARIGLAQMEGLRSDLINMIKRSEDPKWKVIFRSFNCCCDEEKSFVPVDSFDLQMERERDQPMHPTDSDLALTTHTPLFPPGKIIHIVRNHPKSSSLLCRQRAPVYQAIIADNTDFDEVLISPTMINDHMPDNVLSALRKVLVNVGPAKPTRKFSEAERKALLSTSNTPTPVMAHNTPPHRIYMETSFTNTNPGESYVRASSDTSSEHDILTDVLMCSERDTNSLVMLRKGLNLDLPGDKTDPLGVAPLATPETLSDTSSCDSASLKRISNGSQKRMFSKMEPIQQSPMKNGKNDHGYCYYVTPNDKPKCSSSDVCVDLTPGMSKNNNNNKPNMITTHAFIESSGSSESKDESVRDLKEVTKGVRFSLGGLHDWPTDNERTAEEAWTRDDDFKQKLLKGGTNNQKHLPVITKTNHTNNNVKQSSDTKHVISSSPYQIHLPDKTNKQLEYHCQQGHYSHGSRGYPHGGYQAPYDYTYHPDIPVVQVLCHAESDSDMTKLAHEQEMHRTIEEPEIMKLQDDSQVHQSIPINRQRFRHRSSNETSHSSPSSNENEVLEYDTEHRPSIPYSDDVFVVEVPENESLEPLESDV